MGNSLADWACAIGALAGAAILALRVSWSGWGFAVMFIFSGGLLGLAVAERRWPYVALFLGYEAVNVVGIYRWLVAA